MGISVYIAVRELAGLVGVFDILIVVFARCDELDVLFLGIVDVTEESYNRVSFFTNNPSNLVMDNVGSEENGQRKTVRRNVETGVKTYQR